MAEKLDTNYPSRKRLGSDKIRLRKMRTRLVDGLTSEEINTLVDQLYSENIFIPEHKNRVNSYKVVEDKTREFLDILEKKCENTEKPLDIVIDCLKNKCNNEGLSNDIIDTDGFEPPPLETEISNDSNPDVFEDNTCQQLETPIPSQSTDSSLSPLRIPSLLNNPLQATNLLRTRLPTPSLQEHGFFLQNLLPNPDLLFNPLQAT